MNMRQIKEGGDTLEELAEKMIEYRAKNRISQRELARRVGISVQTVNAVENCLQEPSKLTKAKICLVIDEKEGGKND